MPSLRDADADVLSARRGLDRGSVCPLLALGSWPSRMDLSLLRGHVSAVRLLQMLGAEPDDLPNLPALRPTLSMLATRRCAMMPVIPT